MKASIIILNWNGLKYLKECLNSVYKQTFGDFEVILVDNYSKDSSVSFVRHNFPKTRIIKNKKNFGFAKGNNMGIKKSKGKYIVLLNNDTIVDKNWLKELVKTADERKEAGMISPKTYLKSGGIDTLGLKMTHWGLAFDIKEKKSIKHLLCPSGVSCLYKKSMLKDIEYKGQYFDEDLFCYSEDLDLGIRAVLKGWECAYSDKSTLFHVHGGSTKGDSKFSKYYGNRNNLWVVIKDYPALLLLRDFIFILLSQIGSILIYALRGNLLLILKSKLDVLRNLRKIMRNRKTILNGIKPRYSKNIFYKIGF